MPWDLTVFIQNKTTQTQENWLKQILQSIQTKESKQQKEKKTVHGSGGMGNFISALCL